MKKHILYLLLFIIIFTTVFRSLIINITSNLIDWRDYTYLAWLVNHNISNIKNLNLGGIFNYNTLYPHQKTIFLSDTLFPQSLIGTLFSFLTDNPVLIFNIIFILTFILNYLSAYTLWTSLFKKHFISFIGALVFVFSPFYYTQLGHFQMQNYWPFLFSITILLNNQFPTSKLKAFLLGLLITIQFLSSVYLSIFLLFSIGIYFLINIFNKSKFTILLRALIVTLFTFLLTSGVFIKGYFDIQKNLNIKRGYGEYVMYSAHITDYFFPKLNSIPYNNKLFTKWNSYNLHSMGESASFPGIILTLSSIFGILYIKKEKKHFSVKIKLDLHSAFFLSLLLFGLVFSFGPRLNFNGFNSSIPTIYTLLLKYIPFFEILRTPSRWSFLFYFGLIFFSLLFLNKIKSRLLLILISIVFLFEVIPQPTITQANDYITDNDYVLKDICSKKATVILEVPVTHFDTKGSLIDGLTYINSRILATHFNKCYMVNGYSSYDLPEIQDIMTNIIAASNKKDYKLLALTLKSSKAQLLVINHDQLRLDVNNELPKLLNILEKESILLHLGEGTYYIK